MFTSALRHVLLGPRECLLIGWGDGVWECWDLQEIHTMLVPFMSPLVNYSWWEQDKPIVAITQSVSVWRLLPLPMSMAGLLPWLTNILDNGTTAQPLSLPSAVLNLLIPFPLAFSFYSFSLWDLVRLTGVHPSDHSSSVVAGHCLVCHQQLRCYPAWSKDREFRVLAEMEKRCLFFSCPILSCSAHVSGQPFSSTAPQTASDSFCGHAQVMAPKSFGPDGIYSPPSQETQLVT